LIDPYDPDVHGPDVGVAAAIASGGADDHDLEDGSGAEAPPRRRTSIASGLGALVRPSREVRFGLAALLSFLILVTVLIMKREKPRASARGNRPTPVARIGDSGPAPSELALAPAASAPAPEAPGPAVETPPVPPPAAESRAAEPPIAPAPPEVEAVPARVDPIQLAAAEKEKEKAPLLPPDLAADSSAKPGAKATAEPPTQPPLPADPVPAPSPGPAPARAASTAPEVPEAGPPASSPEASPEPPKPGAPAVETPLPAPSSASDTALVPTPSLSPIVDLPSPAAPTSPPASEPPAPMPSPAPPPDSPATVLPASPDPAARDAASAPELPAPADARIPPTPPEVQEPPAPPESRLTQPPADAPAPELPEPVDDAIPPTTPPVTSPEPMAAPAQAKDVPSFATPPQPDPSTSNPTEKVTIPNISKGRLFGKDLGRSAPPADTTIERPNAPDRDAEDRVESVPHVVQKGENFWTISRLSYGSGRFYKALWAANRQVVPVIDELYVGTTILIPPPEALDHSLILPAKTTRAASPAVPSSPVRRTSRSTLDEVPTEPKEIEVHLPAAPPSRRGSTSAEEVDPEPEVGVRPRLPVYRIRANETLRSIANRTLGDSHRAGEILELNRTVIKDPNDLTTGQEIKLPEDARVGRRAR